MKTNFLLIVFLFLCSFYCAQDSLKMNSEKAKVFGFSPSKNVKNVNGVLFKYYDEEDSLKPKKTNGINMGFNFLGIFMPPLLLVSLPTVDKWNLTDYEVVSRDSMNKINGLQLSLINMEPTITNGVEISMSSNIGTQAIINGVSFSPFFNIHHEMRGLSVAPLANVGKKCRGLQIGVYNKCDNFRGVQIGWWNENEKRKLPLINWNFKAKKS